MIVRGQNQEFNFLEGLQMMSGRRKRVKVTLLGKPTDVSMGEAQRKLF